MRFSDIWEFRSGQSDGEVPTDSSEGTTPEPCFCDEIAKMEDEISEMDSEIAEMEADIDRYILTYKVVGLRDPAYAMNLDLLKARHGRISMQQIQTKWNLVSIKENIEANGLKCGLDSTHCRDRR